ncbi:hypothetical protein HNQ80_004523 [Anaerosolibacter carboniphilus]|uniref:DUF4367 domain-containing protein n=1 Tax=Anaerosolibacter carboniphilus TaxID=1417629 RepID=A0A841L7I6_9FIRM|nr:hypothetical protein [Anaerosolibacter carboniphilus]MBB6218359.1 hypothetical protein [Anaerosolibacter carboniphilus]
MCYKIEVLQQIIDNEYEGDVQEALAHIETCPACKENFMELKESENVINKAFQMDMFIPPRPNIGMQLKNNEKRGIFQMGKIQRRFAAVAAGIILCGGVFFIEPIRVTANDLLKMFRVQEFKGISINQSDLQEIERLFREGEGAKDIENFGKIDVSFKSQGYKFKYPIETAEIKGKMPDAKLPVNTGDFVFENAAIEPQVNIELSLDVYKINDFLKYIGEDSEIPLILHEKPFVIHTKDVLSYAMTSSSGNGKKSINIAQMEAPVLEIPGDIDEEELVDSLFSMNFLPKNIKNQLMAISDITSTLPVPYHGDRETKRDITVLGEKAILIESTKSTINYLRLIFKKENKLYFINANNCSVDEVLSIVESME